MARSACHFPPAVDGVQILVATCAPRRRPSSEPPSTRSASPYIGDESKNVAPASNARSTTARALASETEPLTSNVFQVPMPMTGTVSPDWPSLRRSIDCYCPSGRILQPVAGSAARWSPATSRWLGRDRWREVTAASTAAVTHRADLLFLGRGGRRCLDRGRRHRGALGGVGHRHLRARRDVAFFL